MSEALKIMIVEDEAIVAMDLGLRLEQEGYTVTGVADNSDEALTLFRNEPPDLVLMDINIKGRHDGIETVRLLKQVRDVPVIFLTAFSQSDYVNRAKEVNPAAYLVKPFNQDSLYTSIQIAIHNFAVLNTLPPAAKPATPKNEDISRSPILFFNNYFFVKNNYRFTKIAINDLLFAESDNNYIKLVTRNEKLLIRVSLQFFSEAIQHQHLVRVHRGFVVNIQNIDSFNEEEIAIGRHQVPIGRAYKEEFLRSFNYL
ncbi:MAG: response regulator [Dinghuibacter sp.]|nr:response regulator [Dinghuibacter sp.]